VNVLALDLGTRTGWALCEGGRIESGVQVFDVKRGESPGMRYVRFNRWLAGMYVGGPSSPDIVVYEQTHNRGGAATEVAAGFATRVQEWAATYGVQHAAVHSATLKKFTTGSGRGQKDAMHSAALAHGWLAHDRLGDWDDNRVDAICLLHYALAEIVPAGSVASAGRSAPAIPSALPHDAATPAMASPAEPGSGARGVRG